MISTQSLRIDYDDTAAVRDLNLDIPRGQVFGLVGPNGAGKTSTIKSLAGIVEPTYGEIKIAGFDLELNPAKALRQVGYMPDFPPVYENLKVWEYLDVFAAAYLMEPPRRREKVAHWVQRVGLKEKTHTFIRELSRGMRQRLVLAKTLIHEPSIFLLDEPASGMDPIARKEFRDIFKERAENGATILISSHILSELSDFCNAIGIMEKGKMVISGTMNEIRRHLGGGLRIHIQLSELGDKSRLSLMKALKKSDLIRDMTETHPGSFEGLFTGDEGQASEYLRELISRGFPICEFFFKKEDMEDIFLKIGASEVS